MTQPPMRNSFDAKRALHILIQYTAVGYVVIALLVAAIAIYTGALSGSNWWTDYLREITNPWLLILPAGFAAWQAYSRGIIHPDFDPEDPQQQAAYTESQKWINQPWWGKAPLIVALIGLVWIWAAIPSPDDAVPPERLDTLREDVAKAGDPEAQRLLEAALSDGVVKVREHANIRHRLDEVAASPWTNHVAPPHD